MNISPAEEGQFISQDLIPALAGAGLDPLVLGGDEVSQLSYGEQLMATPGAAQISWIAWHCYGGTAVLSAFHTEYPALPELMSGARRDSLATIPPRRPSTPCATTLAALIRGASGWTRPGIPSSHRTPDAGGAPACSASANRRIPPARASGTTNSGNSRSSSSPPAVILGDERWVQDYAGPARMFGVTVGLDDVAAVDRGGRNVVVVYNSSGATQQFAVAWRRWQFAYTLPAQGTVTFTRR